MNKDEFIKLVGIEWDDISEDEYSIVEYVYSRHPAISSKQDIANIWSLPNGMMIIRDMVETACKAEKIEQDIYYYQEKCNRAKKAYEALKLGRTQDVDNYLEQEEK